MLVIVELLNESKKFSYDQAFYHELKKKSKKKKKTKIITQNSAETVQSSYLGSEEHNLSDNIVQFESSCLEVMDMIFEKKKKSKASKQIK